jgi:antitoxin (DNA-binding transcriptional repressor) of toxin-antitoxin stability system
MDAAPDDTIELDDHPELAALADRIAATGRPCRITRHGKEVGRLIPGAAETPEPVDIRGPNWKRDPDASRRAAGAWVGIVDDDLVEQIYAARAAGTSNRPPVHF